MRIRLNFKFNLAIYKADWMFLMRFAMVRMVIFWIIGNFWIAHAAARVQPVDVYQPQCTPIIEPICTEISYSQTGMPNLVGMQSQQEASKRIQDYSLFINIRCSHYVKLFLCSVYFPMCIPDKAVSSIVKPCRSMCLYVKQRCEQMMQQNLGSPWPDELNCDKFPEKNPRSNCIAPDSFNLDEPEQKPEKDEVNELYQKWLTLMGKSSGNQSPAIDILRKVGKLAGAKCLPSEINIGQSPNTSCAQRCHANVRFSSSDKTLANVWMLGWAVLCFFSCLLTIIVFSCNTHRFLYPEKPIVFLSICYFFYASGNLLGAILGRKIVSCRPFDDNTDFIVSSGKETTWCKINFLMVYFFGSASALWWVVLTITWFLSASRHWGYEAIDSISSMLHLVSWAIPALKSIFILIIHKIDSDELTGQCFVGNTNQSALWGFVIIPHILYLTTGVIFLSLGYVSLLKVRRSFLQRPDCIDTNNLKRLEKLMAKIGVFSILYIVPVLCTVVSYIIDAYKMTYFDFALKAVYKFNQNCVTENGINWSMSKCTDILQPLTPSVEMRMLRIFMNLVIGITSGIWIWGNTKTMKSCFNTFKCWSQNKETNQCESITTQNNFPLTQIKQKESLLPYTDWKASSPYPNSEFTMPSISVPSVINPAPHNSSISSEASRH